MDVPAGKLRAAAIRTDQEGSTIQVEMVDEHGATLAWLHFDVETSQYLCARLARLEQCAAGIASSHALH